MQRGQRRAVLFILVALCRAGPSAAVVSGEPLAQALAELRREGLALIFSSALIDPSLTVKEDPGPGTPEEIAGRILAPYGLGLRAVRRNLFAVVKLSPSPPAAAAPQPREGAAQRAAAGSEVAEIDVYASRYGVDQSQSGPQPSTDISRQELETLPGLFQDAMRAVRYLPGTATSAISARPHVRGGREDEVANFFDGVPLFEPYHYKDVQALLGTLDPETLSTMNFFSGVFPARYGNRLSGVLDMQPRTWDGQNYYALSQSLLYSEALTQGRLDSTPLQWLGAVRFGVVDFVADLLDRTQVEPNFMDALGRVQYDFGEHATLAAGYLVLDDNVKGNFNSSATVPPADVSLTSIEQAHISYRDGTGWLGWGWNASDANELHATISRTERHTHRVGSLHREGSADSTLEDTRQFDTTTARLEDTLRLSDQWHLNAGIEWYDYHANYDYANNAVFDSRLAAAFDRAVETALRTNLRVDGRAYAAYTSALWAVSSSIALDVGARWDGERFGTAFRADQVSPRLSFRYTYDAATVLRASWGRTSQTQRPDELQVDDGDNSFHRAEFATQAALGLERRLSPDVQLHVEAFDKRIADPRPRYENVLDPIALLPELEVDRIRIQASSSRAFGAELSMRWKAGEHWSGWGSYSWSEATDVIDGRTVPRSWDQKHAASVGIAWRKSPWLWSADMTWHTGWGRNRLQVMSVDPPTVELADLNVRTWPAYFSLDSRLTWSHLLPKGSLELFGEIDNATNHANPCCTDVQIVGETARPLLERTTSVWLPRFALVGATWKLP